MKLQNLRAFTAPWLFPAATVALAAAIFIADTVANLEIAFPAFYTAVVLMSVRFCGRRGVANEGAMKLGIMYTVPTKTTVGVIGERMHRYVPADLDFQNERTRYGTWLVVSQELSPVDSLHFGWAHAFASPGNPGQRTSTSIRKT